MLWVTIAKKGFGIILLAQLLNLVWRTWGRGGRGLLTRTTDEEEVDHKAEELEAGRRQADLLLTHPAAPVEPPPPARTPPRAPSTPPPARPSTRSPPRYPSTSPGTAKVVTVPVLRLEADGRQMSPRAANIRALGTAFNNSSTLCRASPQTAPSTRPGGSPTSSSRGHASVSDGTSQASQSTNLSTDEEGRGKRERRKDWANTRTCFVCV